MYLVCGQGYFVTKHDLSVHFFLVIHVISSVHIEISPRKATSGSADCIALFLFVGIPNFSLSLSILKFS